MGLKANPANWQGWRDFAPLYMLVNLPLILVAAALLAYLPPEKPVSFANVSRETVFMLYISGAMLSTLASFPWQWRFLRRCISLSEEFGRFDLPVFTLGFYWRNLLVSIITAAVMAVPLFYLIFFLVGFPLMMMLVPVHLFSGFMIGLLAAKFFSTSPKAR
ncbi:MAG: hypothetical protein KAZ58_03175 [Arenimonas sp.]|jgi:hypothetical protein|nr:hypothetical protein [Arenimonas sp.]